MHFDASIEFVSFPKKSAIEDILTFDAVEKSSKMSISQGHDTLRNLPINPTGDSRAVRLTTTKHTIHWDSNGIRHHSDLLLTACRSSSPRHENLAPASKKSNPCVN